MKYVDSDRDVIHAEERAMGLCCTNRVRELSRKSSMIGGRLIRISLLGLIALNTIGCSSPFEPFDTATPDFQFSEENECPNTTLTGVKVDEVGNYRLWRIKQLSDTKYQYVLSYRDKPCIFVFSHQRMKMNENSPPKFVFSSEPKLNQPQDFIFTPALRPIVIGGSTVGQVTLYDKLSKKVAENFFMDCRRNRSKKECVSDYRQWTLTDTALLFSSPWQFSVVEENIFYKERPVR